MMTSYNVGGRSRDSSGMTSDANARKADRPTDLEACTFHD